MEYNMEWYQDECPICNDKIELEEDHEIEGTLTQSAICPSVSSSK